MLAWRSVSPTGTVTKPLSGPPCRTFRVHAGHLSSKAQGSVWRQLRAQSLHPAPLVPVAEEILWNPDEPGVVPLDPAEMESPDDDFNKAMRTAELLSGRREGWRLMHLTSRNCAKGRCGSVLTVARFVRKGVLDDEIPLRIDLVEVAAAPVALKDGGVEAVILGFLGGSSTLQLKRI